MKTIRVTDSEFGFPYIAFISDDASDNPAMIVQLHGAGERGNGKDDLDAVLVHGFGSDESDFSEFHDCVLILPQCPVGSFWSAKIESLKLFIDKMVEIYNADKNRLYLAGLSMGGFGTWYTAMAYPDMFAAIIPCCGGGMPWYAYVLKMPVWAFHGACDGVVTPIHSIEMVEALKKTNDRVKFDLFEGVGHDSWVRAFTSETMKWLLEQKK